VIQPLEFNHARIDFDDSEPSGCPKAVELSERKMMRSDHEEAKTQRAKRAFRVERAGGSGFAAR
jgi:hypothetical protein